MPSAGAAAAAARRAREEAALGHPVVEVLKHVTSPLSVALYVFVAGKYYVRSLVKASVKAKVIVAKHAIARRLRPAAASQAPQARQMGGAPPGKKGGFSAAAPIVPAALAHVDAAPHESTGVAEETVSLLERVLPVEQAEHGLRALHEWSGMPWWATLAAGTVALRLVTTPFNVALLRNSLRLKLVKKEAEGVAARLDTEPLAAAEELRGLFKRAKCHPLGNLSVPLLFPPLVLTVFGAVHRLCEHEPTMASGGLLWFPDLMATDPTFVLPALSGLTWLWNVEIAAGAMYASSFKLRAATRAAAVAMIPVASTLPAGIFVFWLTSNAWEITRIMTLRRDDVRTALRIPLTSELPVVPRDHISH